MCYPDKPEQLVEPEAEAWCVLRCTVWHRNSGHSRHTMWLEILCISTSWGGSEDTVSRSDASGAARVQCVWLKVTSTTDMYARWQSNRWAALLQQLLDWINSTTKNIWIWLISVRQREIRHRENPEDGDTLCQVHSIFYPFLNGQVQQVLSNPAMLHMLSLYTRTTILSKKKKGLKKTWIVKLKFLWLFFCIIHKSWLFCYNN